MSAYQFIELNSQYIQNIDGCLTESANITLLDINGKMVFYYFESGELVNSKMGR
jgi:hypothetical protein